MFKPSLSWCRYSGKYYLILNMGTHDTKTIGLLSKNIPDNVALVLRKLLKDGVDRDNVLEYLHRSVKDVYNSAYREFETSKLEVLNSYEVPGL